MNEQPVSQIPFKGDWGRFPNKQICEDCTGGEIEKMSEPVQVYTACQFVIPSKCVLLSVLLSVLLTSKTLIFVTPKLSLLQEIKM